MGYKSDSDEEEVTVLEYARFHGLCQEYTHVNLLDLSRLPSLSIDVPDFDVYLSLETELKQGKSTADERWVLDKGGATLIKDIVASSNLCSDEDDICHWSPLDDLRTERPILATDHQLDMQRFFSHHRQCPDLSSGNLEFLTMREMPDPVLEWPSPNIPLEKDVEISSERIVMSGAVARILQEIICHTYNECDDGYHSDVQPSTAPSLHVSPILLPLSPQYMPELPDSKSGNVQLTSSPSDPTEGELAKLENRMMQDDEINVAVITKPTQMANDHFKAHLDTRSDYVLSSSPIFPPISPPKRPRSEDVRLEVPLTPPNLQSLPIKKSKTVSFLDEVVKRVAHGAYHPSSEETQDEDAQYLQLFDEIITCAEPAIYETANEQLNEADSIARLPAPPVVVWMPPAPWKVHSLGALTGHKQRLDELDAQRQLLVLIKDGMTRHQRSWPGSGILERHLDWSATPSAVGRGVGHEQLDNASLDLFMSEISGYESADIVSLVWTSERLRILDETEDDAVDIEQMAIEVENIDMGTLVRRRHAEIDCAKRTQQELGQGQRGTASSYATGSLRVNLDTAMGAADKNDLIDGRGVQPKTSLLLGGFSASNSLSKFMQVQTGSVSKERKPHLPTGAAMAEEPDGHAHVEVLPVKEAPQTVPPPPPRPVPSINLPSGTRQFVTSPSMLLQRSLMRAIERLFPLAEFFERDFASRSGGMTKTTSSPARHMEEADMGLSPSKGLVLTTLQKIKQKSLPGQPNLSGIRERILGLAPRYEHLIVLVSECATSGGNSKRDSLIRTLDESDCSALVSLIAFAASADAGIEVLYIPGGETELAAWTVSIMVRYAVQLTFSLEHEETIWELFLRQAGLNAFAAQTVLGMLKAAAQPDDERSGRESALSAFVRMGEQERIRRFSALIGGEQIRKVSRAVDGRWVFAANDPGTDMDLA